MSKLSDTQKSEILIEATRVSEKYPDFCTIYCESKDFVLNKNKYLVKKDVIFGQLIHMIRKKLNLAPENGLFFLVKSPNSGDILAKTSDVIGFLYNQHKNHQMGCLHIVILKENVFGEGTFGSEGN